MPAVLQFAQTQDKWASSQLCVSKSKQLVPESAHLQAAGMPPVRTQYGTSRKNRQSSFIHLLPSFSSSLSTTPK